MPVSADLKGASFAGLRRAVSLTWLLQTHVHVDCHVCNVSSHTVANSSVPTLNKRSSLGRYCPGR
jgi:hypothetical protein